MQIEIDPPKLLTIRTYPDPILKQACKDVPEVTKEIKTLVQNMFITMYNKEGVGLSANQVGELHRIFVMDTSASGNRRRAFINPRIIASSDVDRWKEGCLSFPGVFAFVKRPTKIKINALDEEGKDFELYLEGLDAICFQHELDHLNGITFYDHLSQLQKSMLKKKMSKINK
jgi:peptide deformylase